MSEKRELKLTAKGCPLTKNGRPDLAEVSIDCNDGYETYVFVTYRRRAILLLRAINSHDPLLEACKAALAQLETELDEATTCGEIIAPSLRAKLVAAIRAAEPEKREP